METVKATLYIEVIVHCPNCDYMIDLLDEDDTDGVAHNDEGGILMETCPQNGNWSDSHDQFVLEEVVCSQCKTEFRVEKVEW